MGDALLPVLVIGVLMQAFAAKHGVVDLVVQ
jgi:hypothetical protein